jgi:hypothetical protein
MTTVALFRPAEVQPDRVLNHVQDIKPCLSELGIDYWQDCLPSPSGLPLESWLAACRQLLEVPEAELYQRGLHDVPVLGQQRQLLRAVQGVQLCVLKGTLLLGVLRADAHYSVLLQAGDSLHLAEAVCCWLDAGEHECCAWLQQGELEQTSGCLPDHAWILADWLY